MEFKELLEVARNIRAERVGNMRDYLEMVQTLDDTQENVLNILIENGVNTLKAIEGVYNQDYSIYDNFIDYIDNFILEEYKIPDWVEFDYIAMWYQSFRYEDNLYFDIYEPRECNGRHEFGTEEQREKERLFIEYNLKNSMVIEFYA